MKITGVPRGRLGDARQCHAADTGSTQTRKPGLGSDVRGCITDILRRIGHDPI
jgi:hypothetical protein